MKKEPKYKLNEAVWCLCFHGAGGVIYGVVSSIQITEKGAVIYMVSSDQSGCHTHRESEVWLTQGEAWAQRQKMKDESKKAHSIKS